MELLWRNCCEIFYWEFCEIIWNVGYFLWKIFMGNFLKYIFLRYFRSRSLWCNFWGKFKRKNLKGNFMKIFKSNINIFFIQVSFKCWVWVMIKNYKSDFEWSRIIVIGTRHFIWFIINCKTFVLNRLMEGLLLNLGWIKRT